MSKLGKRAEQLFEMASELAASDPGFQSVKGPGAGDHATQAFLRELGARAKERFNADFSEMRICGSTSYAVDFYLADEATIVEVALGLPNPSSEFEKDILKAIIAQDFHPVRCLALISRAGGEKKCRQPGRSALRDWARTKHGLEVIVLDLPGEVRKRKRARR